MLKYRAISFPLLLALLGAIIFWKQGGPWIYVFLTPVAIGMVIYEIGAMLRKVEVESFAGTAAVLGGLVAFHALSPTVGLLRSSNLRVGIFYAFCVCFFFLGWLGLLFVKDKRAFFVRALHSLGILVLAGVPLLILAMVYNLGPMVLLYLMLVTKMMDTGGYIFGMLSSRWMKNGNHKIFPAISPKKSWEGTIGGILFSMAVSLLFWKYAPIMGFSLWWHVFAGYVLAIGSLAGDLSESALKRTCGIKDSGNYIPGMGGAFDVLDSFIYNGALFWGIIFFGNMGRG